MVNITILPFHIRTLFPSDATTPYCMKFRCKTGSPPNAAEVMAENTVIKAYKLKRISSNWIFLILTPELYAINKAGALIYVVSYFLK